MRLSYFTHELDNDPKQGEASWDELVAALSESRTSPCTSTTCTGKTCPHKLGPGWSATHYAEGAKRGKKNVLEVSALALDLDYMTDAQLAEVAQKLQPYQYIAHSTHNDLRDGLRAVRVILPLDPPVSGADWPRFWSSALNVLDVASDPATKDASRIFFLPSRPSDRPALFTTNPGVPLPSAAILAVAPPATPPRDDLRIEVPEGPVPDYVIQHARERLQRHGPSIVGKNGDRHAYQVGAILGKGYGFPWDIMWPLALEWNDTAHPEPMRKWTPEKLEVKIRNGAAYGEGDGELYAEALAVNVGREVLKRLTRATPGTFAADLEAALADVKAAMGELKDDSVEPLFVPATELMGKTFPPTPWVVEGLLTEGGVIVVGGEPKTSKSWVGCEIAMAVATGTRVFGEFSTKPMTTAYFFAEDLDVSVRNRLRSLAAGRGLPELVATERMHVQPRGKNLDLTKDEHVALLVASARRLGPIGLLVLDPLRDIHSGEEDKADSMAPVMKRLRLIGNLLNCTVVVVHHTAKANDSNAKRRRGQQLRGSSVIHGSIDGGIYLYDLKGNDEDVFINSVQSEVKGAKAAGRFSITLKITDDATGSAVKAEWTLERGGPKNPEEADHEAEARVIAAVTKSPGMPRSTLRQVCGLQGVRADAAITRLLGTGALTLDEVMRFDETKRMRRVVVINLGIAAQGAA